MKVLMLASGNSIHSQRQLSWLLERGCKVLFSDRFNPCPRGHGNYLFVPYVGGRGARPIEKIAGPRAARFWWLRTATLQLRLMHYFFKPDIVHVHQVNRYAHICARAGLKPLVLSVWGSDVNLNLLPDADPDRRQAAGQALAHADLVLVDAPDMAEKCSLLAGRKIHTEFLSIGVDTMMFRPDYCQAAIDRRRRLNIPPEAPVLLSARAWKPLYGHHHILEAFALARSRLKTDAFLVFKTFASNSEAYEADVRRRAQDLGVSASLRWIGRVDFAQMPELYAFADVIVNFPSVDAFPVTFLEAAASERPVISCRLPAYVGTFAERYFRMVEPGNVSELADAMVEVIETAPEGRAEHLAEARQVVQQEYDETISAQRLLGMYQDLATARASARIPTEARTSL